MKRVVTAAILLPPVLYLILLAHPALVLAAVALVAVLCFHEYQHLVRAYELNSLGPFGYAAGLALLLAPRWDVPVLTVLVLLALVLSLRTPHLRRVLPQAAAVILGICYVFGPWRCALRLRELSPHWLLYGLVVTWVGDSAAYYAGRAFGRRKLAPVISPKKTWEGSVASVLGSVLFGVLYLPRFVPEVTVVEAILLSIGANVAGQAGDLTESAIKRGAGVKDSGSLLPGHGGLLDRVDGSLFTLPVVYLWLSKPWQV